MPQAFPFAVVLCLCRLFLPINDQTWDIWKKLPSESVDMLFCLLEVPELK